MDILVYHINLGGTITVVHGQRRKTLSCVPIVMKTNGCVPKQRFMATLHVAFGHMLELSCKKCMDSECDCVIICPRQAYDHQQYSYVTYGNVITEIMKEMYRCSTNLKVKTRGPQLITSGLASPPRPHLHKTFELPYVDCQEDFDDYTSFGDTKCCFDYNNDPHWHTSMRLDLLSNFIHCRGVAIIPELVSLDYIDAGDHETIAAAEAFVSSYICQTLDDLLEMIRDVYMVVKKPAASSALAHMTKSERKKAMMKAAKQKKKQANQAKLQKGSVVEKSCDISAAMEMLDISPKDEEEIVECCVCLDSVANIMLSPCGHIITCENCSVGLTVCPICRVEIFEKIKQK